MINRKTQEKEMPKRVTVYADNLKKYIDVIKDELEKNASELTQFANELDPPYPIVTITSTEDTYHVASLALVVHSCLKKLYNELGPGIHGEIEHCVDEYISLPSKNSGKFGDSQPGIEDTTFTDEMLELSDAIADHLVNSDIKVPHLRRAGVTSDKITGSLAIIYTGRELMKKHKVKPDESKTD